VSRLPLPKGVSRGQEVAVLLNGNETRAYLGETVATVMLAEGYSSTRVTNDGNPRGIFCGMGVCFDCLVVVDALPNTRACMTYVSEGMNINQQDGLGRFQRESISE